MIFNEDNFNAEVVESELPVLVDIWADWCGPCKALAPVIDKLAGEFEGRAKVGKLNIEGHDDLAAEYNVMAIPTLLFFKGGELKAKMVGVQSEGKIRQELEKLV